ncbi:MAG: hypothetical protein HY563_05335 [Ignavibacteriales bacterium]|nr:hypothetical protein [Ignavibacteriales bacterium]
MKSIIKRRGYGAPPHRNILLSAIIPFILTTATLNAQERRSVSEAKGLSVGTKAPLFKAIDKDGRSFELASALRKGPVVLRADLAQSQSDESERLPIPATFIIDRGGTIVWRHFDPDYRKRSSVLDIVDHIP